jgi:DNA-binding transcriptional MerR regulator
MTSTCFDITLVRTHRDLMPLEDLAARAGLHPDLLRRFVDFGLVEPAAAAGPAFLFDLSAVHRVRVIQHLRHDLGVNLAGIGVILELLDRLQGLESGGSYGH